MKGEQKRYKLIADILNTWKNAHGEYGEFVIMILTKMRRATVSASFTALLRVMRHPAQKGRLSTQSIYSSPRIG